MLRRRPPPLPSGVTCALPDGPRMSHDQDVIKNDRAGPIGLRLAGDGPTILFLHGLGGTRTAWEPQLEELADEFRCVAWDMPGYGDSVPVDPLTWETIADAAAAVLDTLAVQRTHVVGLSFGGQQALHLALRHPDRIDRLVLADTSARFGADGTDPETWMRKRLDPLDAGVAPADMAAGVIDAVTADGFGGRERERAIATFARIPEAGLRAAVACLPTHDVEDRLGDIRSPTLVIVGEHDRETPLTYSRTLAAGIPTSELVVIPGAGHLTPAEAPQYFNETVRAFLR